MRDQMKFTFSLRLFIITSLGIGHTSSHIPVFNRMALFIDLFWIVFINLVILKIH